MSLNSTNTPFWRDIRFIRILLQILFLLGVLLLAGILYTNMQRGLKNLNLELNLDFLSNEAGFYISEGIGYDPSDAYHNAFWVGILNTIKVSLIGIISATVLGLSFGIARLSSNWLIRNIATAYVEVFRNIPLLLQILFWYTAVIIGQLPLVSNSISLPGSVFINNRGIYLPALEPTPGLKIWLIFICFGILIGGVLFILRWRKLQRLDRPGFPAKWALPVFIFVAICGWLLTPGGPFKLNLPELAGFNYKGGFRFSSEFSALLIGLSVYTGAYIAEIVRSGLQAVAKGQREAAGAVGLNQQQTLRLIVLPQAIPIIVPPLTSQYLNLAKNSSLAVASALLIGLSVYTGAYIAEIVRSGLQAVAKGQREAAGAVGLNQQQTLRLIVLPQAIPIIVPPLTSQYLNLAKNSSLAVAIGFPDVFSIGNTMMSHTGQAIPVFAMIMVSYLIMSLTTSTAMNWYNKWINRVKK